MPTIEIKGVVDGITSWTNCAGCMMFLTRSAIQTVGIFNEDFGVYGFEHADYTNRIHKAHLTPYGQYLSCKGNDKIYALDLQGVGSFNMTPQVINAIQRNVRACKESRNGL
jgi:hypothetical protein